MKTSNKILLATGSGPVILVLLLFAGLRILIGGTPETNGAVAIDTTRKRQVYDVGGFDAVHANGVWDIEISNGENRQIAIHAPESALPYIVVENNNRTLYLDTTKKPDHVTEYPKAFITIPELKGIDLKGVVNLDFKGFRSRSISIRTQGCNLVKGNDNVIDRLHLDGEGLSKIDLSDSPSIHADVDYEGAYKVDLSMKGGRLTGKLDGLGKVAYSGTAKVQSIQVNGPGKVVRLDD